MKAKQIINKSIVLVTVLLQFGTSVPVQKKNNQMLKIDIVVGDKLSENKSQKGSYFQIKTSIRNVSDSSINFWIMSCSWNANWVLDKKNITLHSKECDSNFPVLINLKSNEEMNFNGSICVSDSTIKKFRIGFIFIGKSEFSGMGHDYYPLTQMKKKGNKDVIWSGDVNLHY